MRLGRDVRDALEQGHVFRMLAELVIANQRSEGSAAENAVLFFVNLLKEGALVELWSFLDVAQQFLLGGVEDANLQSDAGLAVAP